MTNTELKMSDVFILPVKVQTAYDREGYEYAEVINSDDTTCDVNVSECEAMSHAINNHDAQKHLVNELTKERDFLSTTIDELSDHVNEAELDSMSLSLKLSQSNDRVSELTESLKDAHAWMIARYDHHDDDISELLNKIDNKVVSNG